MCSYCGCDTQSIIADLMCDHERIGLMARRARLANAAGASAIAQALCAEIAGLFWMHGTREEEGFVHELRAERIALDAVDRLESDHERLSDGLSRLSCGDLSDLESVLADLLDHAEWEDTDLFPAARMLLPNEAWARVDQNTSAGPSKQSPARVARQNW